MLFLGRISGIIVAGGIESSVVDLLTGDLKITQLHDLSQNIHNSSMGSHNGTILMCGGWDNSGKCLQLDHGIWNRGGHYVTKLHQTRLFEH